MGEKLEYAVHRSESDLVWATSERKLGRARSVSPQLALMAHTIKGGTGILFSLRTPRVREYVRYFVIHIITAYLVIHRGIHYLQHTL